MSQYNVQLDETGMVPPATSTVSKLCGSDPKLMKSEVSKHKPKVEIVGKR